jgi:hypothetical protein
MDSQGGQMLEIISGRELFNPGCGERFQEKAHQSSLSDRISDILSKSEVIRKNHIEGHPNNSLAASVAGASKAALKILSKQNFTRDNDKWFGQNAQEALFNIKKLFRN